MKILLTTKHFMRMKKLLFLLLAVLLPQLASAYRQFTIDGLSYRTDGDADVATTVTMYYCDRDVTGAVVIPSTVTHTWTQSNVTYTRTYIVNSIGNSAFDTCTGMTSVSIPSTVTFLDEWAFRDCDGLTSINIPNSVTKINHCVFAFCDGLTSISIPNSVVELGQQVFWTCTNLRTVHLGNQIPEIPLGTFNDCSNLINVYIPNSVTSINGFNHCVSLPSIDIPESVTSISGFNDCKSLKEITIPSKVTTFGDYAFHGCDSLETIYFNAEWCDAVNPKGKRHPFYGIPLKNLYFGEAVKKIPNYLAESFYDITEVTLPNSVEEIGEAAFKNCNGLITVTVGNSVNTIGKEAFYSCNKIRSIVLPNTVTMIGEAAFNGTTGMESFTMSENVEYIGKSAFHSCKGLSDVVFKKITEIGESAFSGSSLSSIVLPNTIAILPRYVFSGCNNLTSFVVPNSVTEIDESAFNNCTGLTMLILGHSIDSIGTKAFNGCKNLSSIFSKISEPSALNYGSDIFKSVKTTTCKLYVPSGTIEEYRATSPWSAFTNIIELEKGDVNVDGAVTSTDVTSLYNYLLDGDETYVVTGDVDDDGSITAADITAVYNILLGN